MKKLLIVIVAVGGLIYFLRKSSPSRAENVSFEAAYTLKTESGISVSGPHVEETSLVVDKDRFALHSTIKGSYGSVDERWTVYNGEKIQGKFVHHPGPEDEESEGMTEPSVYSRELSETELHNLRFWSRSFLGEAGPGGKIAGRDTTLYQARNNMPDSTITVQAWVDSETGIVLKSVKSVYAKQVEDLLNKETVECKSIRYGPVEDSAFAPPR